MPMSGKELVGLFKRMGWELVRINGSHHILAKGVVTITVPVHGNKALGKGLERKLLKQAGIKK
ncbi:MAG: type II toxin-antitoxin system HicA family toxin [Deltaproteobacteria bacterium]|nr:type II toxin-antitoxin system HicA family toxin [Deltaproteobacteria bacterium]